MARVLADHDDPPVPADHFALLTHRLDARSNLHVLVLLCYGSVSYWSISYCSGCYWLLTPGSSNTGSSNTGPSHQFPDAHDIEVRGMGIEDAFLALTDDHITGAQRAN